MLAWAGHTYRANSQKGVEKFEGRAAESGEEKTVMIDAIYLKAQRTDQPHLGGQI